MIKIPSLKVSKLKLDMKAFVIAGLVAAASAMDQVYLDYLNHVARFGRHFAEEKQFAMRLMRYIEVDRHINEVNASGASFSLGHNQFSDWSQSEYKAMLGALTASQPSATAPPATKRASSESKESSPKRTNNN